MASTKDLKKRITTVKNTQQTTRAMKMVSAAKLRRAQEGIQNQRPYARRIGELIGLASTLAGDAAAQSPLLGRERNGGGKRVLLVAVTSDRGLCGAFNSSVIRAVQRWVQANEQRYESIKLGFVGRKGNEFFKTKKFNIGPYFNEAGGKVSFAKACKLAEAIVKLYLDGEVDEVKFIYNEFKNAASQQVVVEGFLPVDPKARVESAAAHAPAPSATAHAARELTAAGETPANYIVRPSTEGLLSALLEKNFSIQAFRILLESQAGEHGARMSAMENATKNAGEMIRKLSLQYNKQRQAGITKELLEIISGSESQKS